MIRVAINGQSSVHEEGIFILTALRQAGIHVPTLCHDDRLTPTGACRSCLVSVNDWGRPVPACATPLADGMVIETHTPELEELRRSVLQLLARRYPSAAFSQGVGQQFHQSVEAFGLTGELLGTFDKDLEDRSHPYISVDMSRCIHCYRCVRICDELQGQGVWHVRDRGVETRIVPDGPSLRESSCVACGACVDTCPSGALQDTGGLLLAAASQWTRTLCPYCGTGCEMNVGTSDGRIVSVRPILDAPVSKGHLCVKGRYAFEFVHAADRITEPMIRQGVSGAARRGPRPAHASRSG